MVFSTTLLLTGGDVPSEDVLHSGKITVLLYTVAEDEDVDLPQLSNVV